MDEGISTYIYRPFFFPGVPKLRLLELSSALSCSGGMSSTLNSSGSSTNACCRSRMIFFLMVFFMDKCRSRCLTSSSNLVAPLVRRVPPPSPLLCRFFLDPLTGNRSSSLAEPTDMALSVPPALTPPSEFRSSPFTSNRRSSSGSPSSSPPTPPPKMSRKCGMFLSLVIFCKNKQID